MMDISAIGLKEHEFGFVEVVHDEIQPQLVTDIYSHHIISLDHFSGQSSKN